MKNVRHYPPMTDGELEDFLDALHQQGAEVLGLHPARVGWNEALYLIASDEDSLRIQLQDAKNASAAWSQIERVHEPFMSVQGEDEIGAEPDTKTFGPYSQAQANAMLAKVKSQGMVVTGSNPWHVDTQTHGVTFDATYDGTNITIKITGSNFYVSNAKVWDKIDPLMQAAKNISGDGALPATKAAADAVPKPNMPAGLTTGGGSSGLLIVAALVALVLLVGRK